LKREDHLKKWIQKIGDLNFKPGKFDVICSAHFHEKDFMTTRGTSSMLLNYSAVPSIFLSMSRNEDSFDPSTMDTCSINANSIQITEKASDVLPKKNLKKNEVHETSTRSLLKINQHLPAALTADLPNAEYVSTMNESSMESSMDVSDTMEHSKVKVKKILHSSTLYFKNQELSPRKRKMQREIKTLKEKLRRRDKKFCHSEIYVNN